MLEEIYEDNLIGDPNDLDQIIEQQGDQQFGEAEEEEAEDSANNEATAAAAAADDDDNENPDGTGVESKKKRVVQNPQPKLDVERLKGPRGITVLENNFKDFKFHGKGYEKFDLDRVMKRVEHWAHRLYPRFQFDDCLEKIEKLGQKKALQVYVKKIRMGLETVDEPMVLLDEADEPEVHNEAPIDEFDELLSQQLSRFRPENRTQVPSSLSSPLPHQSAEPTAEQRERMLRNQLLAKEKKLARLKAKQELQETAEAEGATTSVSNDEASTSFKLPCPKINNSTNETSDAQDVNTTFMLINDQVTNAVYSAHTTCENEETSTFCKAIEVEGTNAISKSVDTENLKILSEPVDEVSISKPVEPVDAVETTTSMSVDAAENATSMPVDAVENAASMPVDAVETDATSMSVDAVETTALMPVDAVENATSMPVDAVETDATSMSVDAVETITSMPVDAVENATSMPFDAVENSMPVDAVETDATSTPADAEGTDVTSTPADAEGTDVTSMPMDA